MAEKKIAHATPELLAINTAPDNCLVGNQVIPFDITCMLSTAINPSGNVNALSTPVIKLNTQLATVAGDAGTGVKSGTCCGKVEILDASTTVYANGQQVPFHDSLCTMNNGNTVGKLCTAKSSGGEAEGDAEGTGSAAGASGIGGKGGNGKADASYEDNDTDDPTFEFDENDVLTAQGNAIEPIAKGEMESLEKYADADAKNKYVHVARDGKEKLFGKGYTGRTHPYSDVVAGKAKTATNANSYKFLGKLAKGAPLAGPAYCGVSDVVGDVSDIDMIMCVHPALSTADLILSTTQAVADNVIAPAAEHVISEMEKGSGHPLPTTDHQKVSFWTKIFTGETFFQFPRFPGNN